MDLPFKYDLFGTILEENLNLVPAGPYFGPSLLIYNNVRIRII